LNIVSFYLLFRIKREELSPRYLWLVGFLMGYAFITDYPSVFILAAIFFYAVYFLRDIRKLAPMVLTGILPGLLLMYYNYACFETILPVGYKYSELYHDLHSQGFISITYPHWDAFYGLTFSPFRGLFFLSPALLFSIPGFVYWFRRKSFRPEFGVVLWSVCSAFLFYGSSVMWWGGFAVGPAYLTAMIPMLAFPFAYFLDEHAERRWVQIVATLLFAASFLLVWAETIGGQSFPDMTPNPLIQLSIPALAAGDIARNLGMVLGLRGWASLIPLAIFMAAAILVLYNLAKSPSTEAQ
jgi:hypothetical protein